MRLVEQQFVQWSELSAGRQALEGADLAPGNKRRLSSHLSEPTDALAVATANPLGTFYNTFRRHVDCGLNVRCLDCGTDWDQH